ncbi:MAG: mandelate racemase/muconate lactonizing enzyme family protein [Chloroflexota bacterium]
MKITAITPRILHTGWRKNWLFVKVETDESITGWGESYTQYDRDTSVNALIEELTRYLVGRDPFHVKHFTTHLGYDDFAQRRGALELYSAVSGIEIALWDIIGKATGQPIYNMLGGPVRDKVRVYANGWSFGLSDPEDYARAAESVLERGFTAMKFDPLPGPWRTFIPKEHLRQAEEVVKAVREATGDDADLLIEVHRRLAPMHAVALAERLAKYEPFWFEEPCPAENLDSMAEIRSRVSIPVVTGEAIYGKSGFRPVLEGHAADITNPDVCSVGGILELKEIAAMAEPYYVAVSPHNYNSTVLGLAATVHASAVMPNFLITEYFLPYADLGRHVSVPLEPEKGYVRLPDAPGLGVEMREDVLDQVPYRRYHARDLRTYRDEGP